VEKCDLNPADGTRSCVADGTIDVNAACSGNTCKAGGLCLNFIDLSICYQYCATDEDCQGGGGLCIVQLNDGQGGVYPEKFCSVNCDPPSNAGCDQPNGKCVTAYSDTEFKWFTNCAGAGTGTQGSDCTANGHADCAPGFGCFLVNSTDNQCLQYCMVQTPVCGTGTCQSLPSPGPMLIGNNPPVEYGACL
jgi:hypothetical protein